MIIYHQIKYDNIDSLDPPSCGFERNFMSYFTTLTITTIQLRSFLDCQLKNCCWDQACGFSGLACDKLIAVANKMQITESSLPSVRRHTRCDVGRTHVAFALSQRPNQW